jgi:hypothetical protein
MIIKGLADSAALEFMIAATIQQRQLSNKNEVSI